MSEYLPGLEGVPATRSNISEVDGERGILTYRGYSIEELAERSTFEETVLLLLDGELPTAQRLEEFTQELRQNYRVKYNIRTLMTALPSTGSPMEMLQAGVSALGMFYPGNECLTGSSSCADRNYVDNMTVKIIARMPALVAMWEHIRNGYDPVPPRPDLPIAQNLLYMFHGEEPAPLMTKIMDTCLILHAEHTINASTFSTLVAGSTLASPYAVVSGAIGTLSGPLHGGANERVIEMLREIGPPDKVEAWLDERLAQKQKIWGFGHRVYKTKDPRAKILQKLMERLSAEQGGQLSPLFETALALEEAATERLGHKGIYANVDFYSGILYKELGLPTDQFTPLFAVSRSAGWLAHWREQLSDNRIFRPTQVYVGKPLRHYVPLNERG